MEKTSRKFQDIIRVAFRIVLGAILLYAAIMKWKSGVHEFAESMANFRILPPSLVPIFSIALLGLEMVLAAFLFLGFWPKEIAWLTTLLFFLFSAAIGSALLRDLKIDCGCFGAQENPATVRDLIFHDLIPLSMSIVLLILSNKIHSQRLAKNISS